MHNKSIFATAFYTVNYASQNEPLSRIMTKIIIMTENYAASLFGDWLCFILSNVAAAIAVIDFTKFVLTRFSSRAEIM